MEGPFLSRSIQYVERWLAEIVATKGTRAAATGSSEKAVAQKRGKATATAAAETGATSMSKCRFVVGRVNSVRPHPESQKLYIEEIDLGEEGGKCRTILSGLQEYVKQEDFLNRLVLVIANLEPRKIGGIPSEGMVLCASCNDEGSRSVVLLDVPEGTPVGERILFEGHEGPYEPVLKKKLAKHFEEVAAELRTNDKGEVVWRDMPFRTSCGIITASIPNGSVS
ncbi:tyrosyl/methionyl-tRNA synthetase, putative [Trypanosoma equiperdum]|uniref:Tyrosyl/methionyl-tRNA synthetase, putative n=4 Tax=Trypanozoon TaxID=39700 RepID=Q57UK5_TRYB2|nr:tyrosyl/methionyl-tRNA synthetase, putative [Trypanosoma brucei gambiense DAL972]XP_847363.1 tyrosyl/methionyl-tRNA synthetase, putative [Trypanosoma brucei brucei TREU927]AAX70714.1 tyrosyl/methionyl-tRNA synthetase, putative [Trypanosoma brucei]RHW73216.1 tyrosyl/methionyl-tRNA synthetase [Trypanosoma brucei equiperdum]SCU68842.1 tyrosyl/methionyl-tRNA synthetase, putative [Trypanosoma equiperdum]AAZ13297.1 tyrosyl/methionyl-tRNA synthetase, putative [Trypanosoma brucei brucei TREU927]CB|eukprot:XP_011775863.1 tyrosyl/methionyl-tRNA synthetase, putative [Trypanosoma brucei gambiense DAL972]